MSRFLKIFDGIDPLPTLLQLQDHPELWDEYIKRGRDDVRSPHNGVSDIWLRYRDRAELVEPKDFVEPHFSVWWPSWRLLTALRPIVFGLAARCEATAIGGVFLTKIMPGGQVAPHDDGNSWHARHYNCKVFVALAGNGRCINRSVDEEIVMPVGSAWTYNNLLEHSVRNEGDSDRICLIISLRRED